jgi:antitoxin PrlF
MKLAMLRSTLTDRGQTTIPAEVRKALDLKPRQQLTYELREDGVLIRPETQSLMDLAGSIKSSVRAASKQAERDHARKSRISRYQ